MYKRITHHIIEEHFDSVPMPVNDLTNKVAAASSLQLTIDDIISKLVRDIRLYCIGVLDKRNDVEFLQQQVLADVDAFGDFIVNHYGSDAGSLLVSEFKSMVSIFTKIFYLARDKKEYQAELKNLLDICSSISNTISKLNPDHWPEPIVNAYLKQYAYAVINQAGERAYERWNLDTAFQKTANSLMFDGPVVYGSLRGMPDFAELLAAGIFKQFPQKF